MANYNFMKTGDSNFEDDNLNHELIDYAQSLIKLFILKATKLGTRYCVLSKRNTLTKEDIEYALKYQAIEFMKQTDIKKELETIDEQLISLIGTDKDDETCEDELSDSSISEDELCDEEDIPDDPFERIDITLITDYDDILFVKKMHHYYEYWTQWKPSNYFEHKIKEAINAMS